MRLLLGVCAVFGIIFLLASISLVIKNRRLERQLAGRSRIGGRGSRLHSKHGYAAAEDDSDYLDGLGIFGSSDKKNGENNEVAENGIFEDEAEGKEEDSAWIMNELKPPSRVNGVPTDPKKQIEQSARKGEVSKVIVVSGAVGATSYLNTLVLTINSKKPYVDNKVHYNGIATLISGQKVDLHLSSPSNDPFWYITLGDTIHRATDGTNLTPVIAYTKCSDVSVKPWEPGAMCEWTVHEGKDIGWKVAQGLRLRSQ